MGIVVSKQTVNQNIKKMIKIDLITCLFFFIVSCFAQKSDMQFDATTYLRQRFDIVVTPSTKIIYQIYKDAVIEFSELPISDEEKEIALKVQWSTGVDFFIDSVYTLDENNNFHGVFLDFMGDSLGGYSLRYYKHGEKDSIWITSLPNGSNKIERYTNGKMNGVWEGTYSDGSKAYFHKYVNGIPVDTSFNWWLNGNLLELEVFDNGQTILHKCFTEDDKLEIECD